jgi:hypothetical protein
LIIVSLLVPVILHAGEDGVTVRPPAWSVFGEFVVARFAFQKPGLVALSAMRIDQVLEDIAPGGEWMAPASG